MKKMLPISTPKPCMSDDAFAGLLRLLLTPEYEIPEFSPELLAYTEYLDQVSPLGPEIEAALRVSKDRARTAVLASQAA